MGAGAFFKSAIKRAGRGLTAIGKHVADPINTAELVTQLPLRKKDWKRNPLLMGLYAGGGLGFMGGIAREVKKTPSWEAKMREEGRYERFLWLQQKTEEAKAKRLQRDMATNAARLASAAPEVYNRILAGRELPRGAVVLGGKPRVDLLEELAYRMASGEYRPPQDTDLLEELKA